MLERFVSPDHFFLPAMLRHAIRAATCAGSACVGSRVLVARCEEEEEGTLEWGDFLNFATDVLEDGARRPDARARSRSRACVCVRM